jgi:hypothetical protein
MPLFYAKEWEGCKNRISQKTCHNKIIDTILSEER